MAGQSQVKSSAARAIKAKILEQFPSLESVLDDYFPRKTPVFEARCGNHVKLVIVQGQPLFFNQRNGPYAPTLRMLHRYPDLLTRVQVDRGAIRFVLSGANIMSPGLTSAGGDLPDGLEEGDVVAVHAEGKVHAMAIGVMMQGTEQIRGENAGHAILNAHFLDDGLWNTQHIDN